jgi:hypothetical protein
MIIASESAEVKLRLLELRGLLVAELFCDVGQRLDFYMQGGVPRPVSHEHKTPNGEHSAKTPLQHSEKEVMIVIGVYEVCN